VIQRTVVARVATGVSRCRLVLVLVDGGKRKNFDVVAVGQYGARRDPVNVNNGVDCRCKKSGEMCMILSIVRGGCFFAEAFWSLRYCGHLSDSCIKTGHESVH